MDERSLRALEYQRIKEILRGKCYSSTGAVYADSLEPATDKEIAERLQRETLEVCEINKYDGGVGLERFDDVRPVLSQITVEGTFIGGKDILKIADLASVSTNVYRSLSSKRAKYPAIWRMSAGLNDFKALLSEINRTLTPDGEVADNASHELVKIRRQIEQTRSRITDRLEKMISSKSASDFLSDRLVTMRDGRYVIPVKDSHKSSVNGIVHDRSSSGATVFMEPLELLPMNNQLRELYSEEKREIERILISLCDKVREVNDALMASQEALSKLDFVHARALLSAQYHGIAPEFAEEATIKLSGARHPLLFIDGAVPLEKVVPLDFQLGETAAAVIITGPNTGGKTVALKTVGIAVLLAQSGLQIPARYARLGIFENVFADIGDEQSIAMSLSTFSGHMKQICNALEFAEKGTLVLLDELGGGTDPVEGAALGEAIIEYLVKSGALAIITTHLGALKTLAGENARIRNASMEFDRKNLSPTYRYQPDLPGSSYAIEVAEKLGMARAVLERAQELVHSGHRDLAKLVTQLEENLARVQKERDELAQSRRATADLEQLYLGKMEKMKKWEKESERLALEKLNAAISDGEKEIEDLVASIKKSNADREITRTARRQIQDKKHEIRQKVEKLQDKPLSALSTVSLGMKVLLGNMKTEAEVLTLPDDRGRLKVRAGNLIIEARLSDLAKMETTGDEIKSRGVRYDPVESINPELDLRGLTFDEAEPKLERYLEDAYLAGLGIVRIIHGKGTGALRQKVTEYLRSHRWVENMQLGNYNEGGVGVTVVKIKS